MNKDAGAGRGNIRQSIDKAKNFILSDVNKKTADVGQPKRQPFFTHTDVFI
ncbi:hypothetical protein GCM10007063_09850 [Lentibacillus kapialis]|uniref:Uncharacterized protein n=1 Tax=Lentibacillus kapialis TaxID=340214 RepID=A0A917UW14_9BACI|nr:hypothetical protein GCM10007063_09850 [Lentibacillus kapialis]